MRPKRLQRPDLDITGERRSRCPPPKNANALLLTRFHGYAGEGGSLSARTQRSDSSAALHTGAALVPRATDLMRPRSTRTRAPFVPA